LDLSAERSHFWVLLMPFKAPLHRSIPVSSAPRKVTDPFYGSATWKRLRAQAIKRDGFQCSAPDCQSPLRGAGGRLIVDHILERTKGGADTLDNLRTLCPLCDNRRHGYRLGRIGGGG
jgi:5-methylcytosine-specific restriction endonuclease McrA